MAGDKKFVSLMLLCVLMLGCGDAERIDDDVAAEDAPQFEPVESPWDPDPGIVFVGLENVGYRRIERPAAEKRESRDRYEHTIFRHTPIRWTSAGIEQAEPFRLEARHYDHWNPSQVALAVDQGELFIADGNTIQHRRPFSTPKVLSAVKVDRRPTSMITRNGIVYVGSVWKVMSVDFNNKGRSHVLYTDERVDPFRAWAKPVDFFVRISNRLVAVDNVVVPKFAFVFDRQASGRMAFSYMDKLPEGPNEQLTHGAALDDTMFLIGEYSHRGGFGQILYSCEVGPSGITSKVLFSHHNSRHNNRDNPADQNNPESWYDMGVVGDRLLIGRSDGVAAIDPKYPDKKRLVLDKGWGHDFVISGNIVLVLANEKVTSETKKDVWRSTIAAYRWDAAKRTLKFIRQDPLPGLVLHSIVR